MNPVLTAIQRRTFIPLLGGAMVAAASPLLVRAQQGERTRRVGVLLALSPDNAEGQARVGSLRSGLEALGWKIGSNLLIEDRWAGNDVKRLRSAAAELVRLNPEVIVAGGSRALVALQEQTNAIPIVFVAAAGSVEHGIVTSASRPTGNLTGFTTFDTFALAGKMLGLLKEVAPDLTRVLLVMFGGHPSLPGYRQQLSATAPSLGIAPSYAEVGSFDDAERAIEAFAREPNGGLLLPPDQFNIVSRDQILPLAERRRLPAIYAYRTHVAAGGLMSYGIEFAALYRPAAAYVDRILKGEKPSDLPVQAPTKYELAINLKTAKALGLAVPPSLLARADEVIE